MTVAGWVIGIVACVGWALVIVIALALVVVEHRDVKDVRHWFKRGDKE